MKRRLLALSLVCSAAFAAEIRLKDVSHIEARGVDVRVFRSDAAEPLFGSVAKAGDGVVFTAALPLVPGESYRVEVKSPDGSWSERRLKFSLPAAPAPTVGISPVPTELPANALKLYLQFSQPMEQGVFLDRISLHQQDGSVVQGAFRETELWSPDGRRLTLWLHPGRQKTGVNLNADEGPVLQEKQKYTLRIAPGWRSVQGVELGKEAVFAITAAVVDHDSPNPARWQIRAPQAGTRDPLKVTFDEPLDPAMLASALKVRCGETDVAGTVALAVDARSWYFIPAEAWVVGKGNIIIDPLLEDLAGNNLLGPFEVDREVPVEPVELRALPFEIGR
ncbi:Ig-like domain-containing protein [Prosthecobacter sp.]|uniref:Ig-like domain-containing protein n=1 Tax=Prosthecobacter sp. TaxID=1965333 RepID=UPI003782D855